MESSGRTAKGPQKYKFMVSFVDDKEINLVNINGNTNSLGLGKLEKDHIAGPRNMCYLLRLLLLS
jgi:hypothetical protein